MGLVAMNSDLRKERESPSFCLTELTHLLDGGKDKTARRKEIGMYMYKQIPSNHLTGVFFCER